MPNCKSFLVTEAGRKHVRRRARFQQHRDANCHQVSYLDISFFLFIRSEVPYLRFVSFYASLSALGVFIFDAENFRINLIFVSLYFFFPSCASDQGSG